MVSNCMRSRFLHRRLEVAFVTSMLLVLVDGGLRYRSGKLWRLTWRIRALRRCQRWEPWRQ